MTQKPVPKAQAARESDMSVPTMRKLVDLKLMDTDNAGRVLRSEVDKLIARKKKRTWTLGHRASQPGKELIYACPISGDNLGGTLIFRDPSDIRDAKDGLKQQHLSHLELPGRDFSGYWKISNQDALELVNTHGILLGVAGKYVWEAARVIALTHTIPFQNRKVFLVERLAEDDLASYLGFAPGLNQTPREAF